MFSQDKIFGYSLDEIFQITIQYGTRFLSAIALLIIGFWLSNMLSRTLRKVLTKRQVDAGLVSFLSSLVSALIKTLVIVTSITQLGVEMTSFVAILASAGLAVGMAFSGTLSNFAGGVMILLFKPFKAGDYILVMTQEGTVKEITIFNTILTTSDNKVVILPNGPVSNGTIVNFSRGTNRRVEWKIPLDDANDFHQVKTIVTSILENEDGVLKTPAFFIGLGDLSSSSYVAVIQAWTKNGNHSKLFYSLNEVIFNELTKAGIRFPVSSMEVKVVKND
ncbi:mechanosensitive ion channel [Crocinitomicaceae bacterium CZZ-1]|uniref:Mechanosensitive ion channel n=1 Tax=Taishania pollutisoli TaxID=2766479 RepID=A0A8J6PAM8_9FLAO|nr:mechanosensitive ion channel domain-containing protein [Taishania pollutisoli]MBC9811202.1 mechanosensitive ion channel [Taishania pollutisoli]MBX2947881.1 mechanosensitive ion channel [Crocinitomicaceae bacterium]NGF74987.1 mechanosensitive ion channel [Fluviicola sp. SGL-29]